MSSLIENRNFRVFISSTFIDMHDERDYLNQVVFPDIQTVCRERGLTFTPIDLRWGINDEESSRGDTLRICLDEVQNSNPFFIGLLAERYGWVPEQTNSGMSEPELAENYNGILKKALADKKSITEMEILLGVLENEQDTDAYFYFKKGTDDKKDEASNKKLVLLKTKIRQWANYQEEQLGISRLLDGYSSIKEMGEQVKSDMLSVINARWPNESSISEVDLVNRKHLGFAQSRRQGYIPSKVLLEQLNDFLEQTRQQVCVIEGESGAGKSALLANWSKSVRENEKNVWLFEHYIGAFGSTSGLDIVYRLLDEIEQLQPSPNHSTEKRPLKLHELWTYLNSKLSQLNKRIVLIFDGLDQLEPESLDLRWIPDDLPSNVHIVVSAISEKKLDESRARCWKALRSSHRELSKHTNIEVKPLPKTKKEKLIEVFSQQHRKKFAAKHISQITAAPLSSNPLFLKNVLEETRLNGRFRSISSEGVTQEIANLLDKYLKAETIDDFFEQLISNREDYFGRELVEPILSLLYSANHGLSELELHALLKQHKNTSNIDLRDIIAVLRSFEAHISNHSQGTSLYQFFHQYIKKAISDRYKLNAVAGYHQALADYFTAQDMSERKVNELPWQLKKLEKWQQLENLLLNIEFVEKIYDKHSPEKKLIAYWFAIPGMEIEDIGQKYLHATMTSKFETLEDITAALSYRVKIIFFLKDLGCFTECCLLCHIYIALCEKMGIEKEVLRFNTLLIDIERQSGNLNASIEQANNILGDLTIADFINEPLFRDALNNQALSLMEAELFEDAETKLVQLLNLDKQILGEEDPLTLNTTNNLLSVRIKLGVKFEETKEAYENLIQIERRVLGDLDSKTLDARTNLALLLVRIEQAGTAELMLAEILKIRTSVYGDSHPSTFNVRVFLTLSQIKNQTVLDPISDLEKHYQQSLQINGISHTRSLDILHNLLNVKLNNAHVGGVANQYTQLINSYCDLFGSESAKTTGLRESFEAFISGKTEIKASHHDLQVIANEFEVIIETGPNEQLDGKLMLAIIYTELNELDLAVGYSMSVTPKVIDELNARSHRTKMAMSHQSALAARYRARQNFDEAIDLLERINTILESGKFDNGPKWLNRSNLAQIYADSGNTNIAKTIWQQILSEQIKTLNPCDKEIINTQTDLAFRYYQDGEIQKAIDMYLQLIKNIQECDSCDTASLRGSIAYLAMSYLKVEDFDNAIKWFEYQLKLELEQYGQRHETVATVKNNLATTLSRQGERLEDAVALYEDVIDVRKEIFGRFDSSVTIVEDKLANLLRRLSKPCKADSSELNEQGDEYTSVLEAYNKSLQQVGPHHPGTLQLAYQAGKGLLLKGNIENALKITLDTMQLELKLALEENSKREELLRARLALLEPLLQLLAEYVENAPDILKTIADLLLRLAEEDLAYVVLNLCDDLLYQVLEPSSPNTDFQTYFDNRIKMADLLLNLGKTDEMLSLASTTLNEVNTKFEENDNAFASPFAWLLFYNAIGMLNKNELEIASHFLTRAGMVSEQHKLQEVQARVSSIMNDLFD